MDELVTHQPWNSNVGWPIPPAYAPPPAFQSVGNKRQQAKHRYLIFLMHISSRYLTLFYILRLLGPTSRTLA